MKTIQHFVGGKNFSGNSKRTGKVFNPATGEQSAEVKLANSEDIDKAVDTAKKAFDSWSNKPPLQRARVMFKFKELIEKNSEELSKIIPVIGVAYKDKFIGTKKFLTEFGNPYKNVGLDENGQVAIEWGVYGVPETFLINKKGKIIYRHAGPLLYDSFKFEVLPLIQEN